MFSVGIIGLPNVGKSTLFKAITKISVPIGNYPFTTIEPHHGIVEVKDKRLEKIKQIASPKKTTPPLIELIDIAGLVENAHKGEGLGNQFLSNINEADLLLEVIKNFSIIKENIKEGREEKPQYQLWETSSPKRDIEIIKNEIIERDKKIILNFLEEIKKQNIKQKEEEIKLTEKFIEIIDKREWPFNKIKNLAPEEKETIKNFSKEKNLISVKPIIYLFNTEKKEQNLAKLQPCLFLNLKNEAEISELTDNEKKEINAISKLDEVITSCYNELDLITFYTIKGEEARANELKRGSNILEAAEKIHSEFREKFICGEVLNFEDFITTSSWQEAKEKGLLKTRGKDYIVKDGDIIEFKI